ncbi:3-hydroxyacyl-ACP dehydratase FabZ family protein [Pseudaquabacterium terrae]|uniref:3-hydroxyacyl-ACP dehydratase FabZ family protein n=1 Tax=Pseudaquabacterium terrae TaxID=2732868 RepID=UPI001FECEB79|nr:MaoC/PaaZ C-terminal domain-containing protein [Aquabacterium terrae]
MAGTEPLVLRRRIAADHPAFAGHFPGRPILPGVLLLAEVVEALRAHGEAADTLTIQAAKFLAPVGPGAELTITLNVSNRGGWRFEIHADGVLAASGSLAAP